MVSTVISLHNNVIMWVEIGVRLDPALYVCELDVYNNPQAEEWVTCVIMPGTMNVQNILTTLSAASIAAQANQVTVKTLLQQGQIE